MNARNCRRCGKIFNYVVGMPICPACKEAMEVKFQEVKEYVREHKGVGIREVAEACDVDPQQIRQWLRDDRLEMTEDSAIMLNCEGCGTPIRSGRFCDKCKAQMLSGLQQVSNSMKPKMNPLQGSNDPNGPRWRS